MIIQLRNIHILSWASQETVAYHACLFVDGMKIGRVSNSGQGGSDTFDGDFNALRRATIWIDQNVPPTFVDGFAQPATVESVCRDILTLEQLRRRVADVFRRKVVVEDQGSIQYFGPRSNEVVTSRHVDMVRATLSPSARILNDTPVELVAREIHGAALS